MGLQLYRRRSSECEADRPEDPRAGKFEEGRHGWKKCRCQIYASGTLGGIFKRQSTDKWEWEKAETVVNEWQEAGTWPARSKLHVGFPKAHSTTPEVAGPLIRSGTVHDVLES